MSIKKLLLVFTSIFMVAVFTAIVPAQKSGGASRGRVCGNPNAVCAQRGQFNDDDIPFDSSNFAVAESEQFYIVIIRSIPVTDATPCEEATSASERQNAQRTFPQNKVFYARGCYSLENNFYSNIGDNTIALAIFAGRTKAEADKFLSKVKKTSPEYKTAYLKRITTGFNGT